MKVGWEIFFIVLTGAVWGFVGFEQGEFNQKLHTHVLIFKAGETEVFFGKCAVSNAEKDYIACSVDDRHVEFSTWGVGKGGSGK